MNNELYTGSFRQAYDKAEQNLRSLEKGINDLREWMDELRRMLDELEMSDEHDCDLDMPDPKCSHSSHKQGPEETKKD